MIYNQFSPHPALTDYIDAYWWASGDRNDHNKEKILPNGCVDIIFNLGSDCKTDNGVFTMQNEKVYLVGPMTSFKETIISPDTRLLGIRFRPAAFSAFYTCSYLHKIKDVTIEFEKKHSPHLKKNIQASVDYFNHYFINKLSGPKHNLFTIIADIQNHKGRIDVQTLAKRHFTTIRQLERSFRLQIGISPKEFISLLRYQSALSKIKSNVSKISLADIAFETGYYDHSHLTNEFKRYTGTVPSEF